MAISIGPTTLLTTVSQVDPIKAYFPLSEQEYMRMASLINARGSRSSMSGGKKQKLVLGDGTVYPRIGFLAADREIDVKTGTIRISATFPNPDRVLRPGQYGRVPRAGTGEQRDALLVPQRAVNELQSSFQVRYRH